MAAPVEFRNYLRRFTLDDARNGVTPQRVPTGPIVNGQQPWDLFNPPVLQFRHRERVNSGGNVVMEWSAWQDVPFVREGDDLEMPESGKSGKPAA